MSDRETVNPFPSIAVAQVAIAGSGTVTIATDAVRQASADLRYYVDELGSLGRVLAILGDYGTGKTHLAIHLAATAHQLAGPDLEHVYVSAPADSFTSLYRTFIAKIHDRKELVQARVRQLYAEVVADSLALSEPTADVARGLRAGELDPVQIIARLHLMESVFLSEVRVRLLAVTDNEAFGTALTLLLRSGFEDAVWEWFSGSEPDPILSERGVRSSITGSEATALEAMGVFALLLSHNDHRFILIVDELDHLLSEGNRPSDDVMSALKVLMSKFVAAGALLILVGLPDLLSALREDVRQRITTRIAMSALTGADTVGYIRERQRAVNGVATLSPFTEDVADYLVDLADGSPRKIVSLCYRLFQRATELGSVVTAPMVRAVARDQMLGGDSRSLHQQIRRALTIRGLTYATERYVDTAAVDFWVPVDEQGSAIAILVSPSLLDQAEVDQVVAKVSMINAAGLHEVILVVGGHLPHRFAGELREAIQRYPIVADVRGFHDQLDAELRAAEMRLTRLMSDDPAATLVNRVNRLGEQQAQALGLILRVAGNLDTFVAGYDQRMADLQREIRAAAGRPNVQRLGGPAELPDAVVALLDGARAAAASLDPLPDLLPQAYRAGQDGAAARRLIRAALHKSTVHTASGLVNLVSTVIESYRRALADWRRTIPVGGSGPADRQRLDDLAHTFGAVLDYLPFYEVGVLGEFSTEDRWAGETFDNRLRHLHEMLAELPGRVTQELLAER